MPIALLLTSLFVLSQSALFIRLAQAPAEALGFWRMAIALPVLLGYLVWHKRLADLGHLTRRQWGSLALCGFFLFTHFYTWFLSVQMTTVANSMILFSSNPLFTALGAWLFFGEPVRRRHLVAIGLCMAGLFFMVRDSLSLNHEHLVGDLWGLACSLLFSAYILVSKGLRHRLHNLPFAFSTYGFVCLYFLGAMLVTGTPFFAYPWKAWIGFSGLAFGSTLLGHSLFTYCLQFFNVNLMSISTLAEPMISALTAYLLLGEPITDGAVVGFVFVAAGIVVLYLPYLTKALRR